MQKFLLKPSIVGLVFLCATVVFAFSGGPPDGVTGGPGEGLCTNCHTTNAPNEPGGSMTITAPAEYLPDSVITVQVNLERAGQQRWGFEVTVLDASDNPVGTMIVTAPGQTQVTTAGSGRQYVKHVSAGTFNGTADASPGWSFDWIAPATLVGPVTFYAAGNAANGNGNNQGDFIYTSSVTVDEGELPSCCVGTVGNVNADGADNVDISDLTSLVNHLFVTFEPLPCPPEANVNGDALNNIDISDLTTLVNHLFITFDPLPACQE